MTARATFIAILDSGKRPAFNGRLAYIYACDELDRERKGERGFVRLRVPGAERTYTVERHE